MNDIPIKSFVDVARNVQDLNATIAVDRKGKKNKLLGGRAVGVLKPDTDNKTLVNKKLVAHNDVFRGQLKKMLGKVYSDQQIDRQYQMIAKAAALLNKKGQPIKGPLTVAQVEVVRIELAHRGLGKLRKQSGGADTLSKDSRQYLLDIAYYRAGKEKYDKAQEENEVNSARSTAPQVKLDDRQLAELTNSVKNALKKGKLGNLVNRQLARLYNSGINEPHRQQLEAWVVLGIALQARNTPGLNPFTLDGDIKGVIRGYKEAKAKNEVATFMNERQKECALFASRLKEKPFSESNIRFHDDAVQDARATASHLIKTGQQDGPKIVTALKATFSKLKISVDDASHDAETVIMSRAYDLFRKQKPLNKKDVSDIQRQVLHEYKLAKRQKNGGKKLYDYWQEPIHDLVLRVYDRVAASKPLRRRPQSPPPTQSPPNVQPQSRVNNENVQSRVNNENVQPQRRVNVKPEKSHVAAKTPSALQRKAYNTLEHLGYGNKLNTQLARLEEIITDPTLRNQASELLTVQAVAKYDQLRIYYRNDQGKVHVSGENMNKEIDKLTDEILLRYNEEINSPNSDKLTADWREHLDKALAVIDKTNNETNV